MTDQQVQTPPTPEKQAQSTEYVVLRAVTDSVAGERTWIEEGNGSAVNAQTAIKAVAEGEGTFVAVPARSWKPLTRKVEKVERDIWS